MARSKSRPPLKDPLLELQTLARDLDLTTLAETLPTRLNAAEQNHLAYTEFALDLLRAEMNARLERRLERGLKRAHLGFVEDLETYDFSIRPNLLPRTIRELCTCRFVEDHRNVLCLGKPGLGKTRIAKTIARAACLAGYSVLFVNTAAMLEDLHGSVIDRTYNRALRRYTKPQLLICDEFGYEPFEAKATTLLFRLVSARYRNGSIILTANTGFTRWKNLFPSEAAAVSTVDRLVDGATILRFTGTGCRKPLEIHGDALEED